MCDTARGCTVAAPHTLTLPFASQLASNSPRRRSGYGTLNTYYADTSVEGCEGKGKPIFRNYMNKVTGELHELIQGGMATFGAEGDTVAVFGHAVFLNAVAVAVAEAMGIPKSEEEVAGLELGEAQGIMCDASAQTVSLCVV